MIDPGFHDALLRASTDPPSHADVFELEPPDREASIARAANWAGVVWDDFRKCVLRGIGGATDLVTTFRYSDGGVLSVYPLSGAAEATVVESWRSGPIAADERRADRKGMQAPLDRLAHALAKSELREDEELRLESIWEIKGRAVSMKNEPGPTALFAVVGAYRRYVSGLPVLGRASVHVKLGPGERPIGWGVEWRRRSARVVARSAVISPNEGAKRVAAELFRLRPERPFTNEEFEPVTFELGYVSSSRRALQRTLQPAWVAVLKPRAGFRMGKVVAVPASPTSFGPVVDPVRPLRAGSATPR